MKENKKKLSETGYLNLISTKPPPGVFKEDSNFCTASEASKALSISKFSLRELLINGQVEGFQIGRNKRWRVSKDSLTEYYASSLASAVLDETLRLETAVTELERALAYIKSSSEEAFEVLKLKLPESFFRSTKTIKKGKK